MGIDLAKRFEVDPNAWVKGGDQGASDKHKADKTPHHAPTMSTVQGYRFARLRT
jgi:hypothetical protein